VTRANAHSIVSNLEKTELNDCNYLAAAGICLLFIRLRLGAYLSLQLLEQIALRLLMEVFDNALRQYKQPDQRKKQVIQERKSILQLIRRKNNLSKT
jgi:hypothetical protein